MKTEIIIAVRGELVQNLQRTIEAAVEQAPVCVVYDGTEPPQKGVKQPRVVPTDEIRVEVPWNTPRGCGQARHYGIKTSKAEIVVLIDGHMTFPTDWIEKIEAHLSQRFNAKHLCCCRMQSLDVHFNPLSDEPQGGAFLAMKSQEVCQEFWALSAKWNKPPKTRGEIGAVMGACYAMRRSWYEKIGEPLQILEAWGGDEELLSLTTHIMGGKVRLLNLICGHIYAAPHQGREQSADEMDLRWSNRQAVIDAIPMSTDLFHGLLAWLHKTRRISGPIVYAGERLKKIINLNQHLQRAKCNLDDLIDRGIVRELTPEEQAACLGKGKQTMQADASRDTSTTTPKPEQPQIIVRKPEICKMCGAVNSFRLTKGARNFGIYDVSYAKCCMCGHKAHIRQPV